MNAQVPLSMHDDCEMKTFLFMSTFNGCRLVSCSGYSFVKIYEMFKSLLGNEFIGLFYNEIVSFSTIILLCWIM